MHGGATRERRVWAGYSDHADDLRPTTSCGVKSMNPGRIRKSLYVCVCVCVKSNNLCVSSISLMYYVVLHVQ